MPTNTELTAVNLDLVSKVSTLKNDLESSNVALQSATAISDDLAAQVEKAESDLATVNTVNLGLEKQLDAHIAANEDLNKQVETLTDVALRSDKTKTDEPEETVKLYWLNPVNPTAGITPTAFGQNLIKEGDHHYAMVKESRAHVELGRKGNKFVAELPKE